MAFKSHFNSGKKTIWVGPVCIPPNQSRMVDEVFLPSAKTNANSAQETQSIFGDLNAEKSKKLVKTLDQKQLEAALVEEQAKENPRKSVVEAIQKSLLIAKKSTGNEEHEELVAYATHWANESVENIKAELASEAVQADEEKQNILNAILDDVPAGDDGEAKND